MQETVDGLLRRIILSNRLVGPDEFKEAKELQEKAEGKGKSLTLDRALHKLGYLTEGDVKGVHRGFTYYVVRKEDKRLAKLAVENEIIDPLQADSCLSFQKKEYKENNRLLRLRKIFVEKGFATPKEAAALQEAVERESSSGESVDRVDVEESDATFDQFGDPLVDLDAESEDEPGDIVLNFPEEEEEDSALSLDVIEEEEESEPGIAMDFEDEESAFEEDDEDLLLDLPEEFEDSGPSAFDEEEDLELETFEDSAVTALEAAAGDEPREDDGGVVDLTAELGGVVESDDDLDMPDSTESEEKRKSIANSLKSAAEKSGQRKVDLDGLPSNEKSGERELPDFSKFDKKKKEEEDED